MNGQIMNSRQNPYYGIPNPPERVLDDFAVTLDLTPNEKGQYASLRDSMLSRSWDSIKFRFECRTPDFSGYSDFDAYMPWKGMRLCDLSPEGEVTAYEGDANFTREPETGDVMVEIPKFYYMVDVDMENNKMELHISPNEHEGWYVSPRHQKWGTMTKDYDKIYISAYFPNVDCRCVSGSNAFTSGEFYRTQNLRGAVPGYYQMDYLTLMTLELLKVVETCSFTHEPLSFPPAKTISPTIPPSQKYNGFSYNYGYHSGHNGSVNYVSYRNIETIGYGYKNPDGKNAVTIIACQPLLGILVKKGYMYISKDPLLLFDSERIEEADYKFNFPGDYTDHSKASIVYFNRLYLTPGYITHPENKYQDFSSIYIPYRSTNYIDSGGFAYAQQNTISDIYTSNAIFNLFGGGSTSLVQIFGENHAPHSLNINNSGYSKYVTSRLIYLPPEK